MKTKLFARRAKGRLTVLIALAVIGAALPAHTAVAQGAPGQAQPAPQVQNLDGAGHLGTLSAALSDKSYESVAALQRDLKALGVSPGPVDGVYGPQTERAVRQYQRQNGLTVDGKAGIQTFSQLFYGGAHGVWQLQSGLASQGFDPGPTDGLYGPKTQRAVTDFQQRSALKVDGIAGPQTLAQLRLLGLTSRPQAPPPPVLPSKPQALSHAPSGGGLPQALQGANHDLAAMALAAGGVAVAIFVLGWLLFQRIERHLEAETERAELEAERASPGATATWGQPSASARNGEPQYLSSRGSAAPAADRLRRLPSEGGDP